MTNEYPENDVEFEDGSVGRVDGEGPDGWAITFEGGWSLCCGEACPFEPKVGMATRCYPGGIGSIVRGLFIDGRKIWYRTEAEQKEHAEIESYGRDAADWLARWDDGRSVWSISMGGIGPGYEQAVQITTAEVLRELLTEKYSTDLWEDSDIFQADGAKIDAVLFSSPTIERLGLSGAQVGGAKNLALMLFRNGPRGVMADKRVKDRHILVSKNFPG